MVITMSDIFLKIINMSISASWIVLAVLLFRFVLKKAPKWVSCALWGIVAIRLICPFSIESVLSLIPSAQTVSPEIMFDATPQINSGIPAINSVVNPIISESFTPEPVASANPLQILIPIFAVIWIIGIAVLLFYTAISYFRIKRKVRTAVLLRDNIYQCEAVASPFVLGVIKPKIYLPFNTASNDTQHIIAHEQAHIKRKDHLWKPLGFLILSIHWFNPLVWLGYVLLCRDIELACDEKVVKELNNEQRADYSQALLSCSVNRRMIAACPLAFGEVGVKERVKSILNYKKPALWLIIVAVILCIALTVGFLTNPVNSSVYNSRYETGKCLYDYVVGSNKQTESNELIFDITSDGKIYKSYPDGLTDAIGVIEEFNYTAEDLKKAMESQGEKLNIGNIKKAYKFSDGLLLQKGNGTVYLVTFFNDGRIMSVFKLKKVGECESSKADFTKFEWFYSPVLSALQHSFKGFVFDTEYTHIIASCDSGMMQNLEADKQPEDKTLRFEKGQTVYWTPDTGTVENIPTTSKVTFTVFNEDEERHNLTVVFECLYRDTANCTFAIYLENSDGLLLTQKDSILHLTESVASDGGNDENNMTAYNSRVSYANYTESGDIYVGALNGSKMPISSVQHLPVYKFDTLEDLENFKKTFSDTLTMDKGWDEVPSFNATVENYDKAFFEENTLMLVYVPADNSTHRFNVHSVYCDGKALSIHIQETTKAEVVDCAMAGWFVTVETEDGLIENCTEFDADLNNAIETAADDLRLKYPQFFDVSTDGGLTVYVWQPAEDVYKCHLANTFSESISDNSFAYITGTTIEEMLTVLSTYDIDKEDITIQPVTNPLSSYYYEIDEAYSEKIRKLFWGDEEITLPEDEEITLPELEIPTIPKLHINCKDTSVTALTGTLSWNYEIEDGKMQAVNGDSAHPLAMLERLYEEALKLPQTDYPLKAELKFDITPDKIAVNSWYIDESGENEEFKAQTDGLNIILDNSNKTCIYEVIATWNSSAKYGGTVRYSFCVMPAFSTQNEPEQTENIETGTYYRIYKGDNSYLCYDVYNAEKETVLSEKTDRPLKISMINDNIIDIEIGMGTGIAIHTYYNVDKNVFSREFSYVLSVSDDLIAYIDVPEENPMNNRKVIVQNIFDKNLFYKEFELDFSDVDTPVVNATFSEDALQLTYLSGETQTQTAVTLNLS